MESSHEHGREVPFDRYADGPVSQEFLSFLPPLPDTPRHPTHRANHEISNTYMRPSKSSHTLQAVSHGDGPPDEIVPQPLPGASTQIKRSWSSHTISTDYPVLTAHQGGMNTPRKFSAPRNIFKPLSPPLIERPTQSSQTSNPDPSLEAAQIRLPETPALPSRLLSPHQSGGDRIASTSFNMLNMGDISLLGDCRLPSVAGDSEDSFDFAIDTIRPMTGRKPRISIAPGDRERGAIARSPVKTQRDADVLDQSTILPKSPAKHQHLLESVNALSKVVLPWADTSTEIPFGTISTIKLPSTRPSPPPRSASKSKRTFPASSSAQSLASVGEERDTLAPPTMMDAGDVSTLLPTTPARSRHLLDSKHNLQNEDFSLIDGLDGPSMFFPTKAPRPLAPSSQSTMLGSARKTPKERRVQRSPVKDADVTLDVKDLMARMSKPKRNSGTEESFMDLLHGTHDAPNDDELLDADEPFLPPSNLTPRHLKINSTIHRSRSARSLLPSTTHDDAVPSTERKARRRSKSLSETIQAIPSAADVPLTKRRTPAKTPRDPTTPRFRSGTTPAAVVSRRISLSTGALPMPESASLKDLDLFPTPKARRPAAGPAALVASPTVPIARAPTSSHATKRSLPPLSSTMVPSAAPRKGLSLAPAAKLSAGTSQLVKPRPLPTSRSMVPPSLGSAVTSASSSRPITAARTSYKPTSGASIPPSGLTRPSTSSLGLPRPANDGSARSAPPIRPASNREFGSDASKALNRPSRSGMTAPTRSSPITSKLSAGPTASPSKREATLQSRMKAMSTPASSLARPSATAAISARLREVQKGSSASTRAPVAGTGGTGGARGGGIPRPTSRLPTSSSTELSSGATGNRTTMRGGSTNSMMDLASMRARIDKLQARTRAGQ